MPKIPISFTTPHIHTNFRHSGHVPGRHLAIQPT
jgi:hypothetical protein